MTQDVVNATLNPRTIRNADAYLELEEDINIVFRQSRLAKVMIDDVFDEVSAICRIADEKGIPPHLTVLLRLKRNLAALDDAVIEIDNAAERAEAVYYAAPT